MENLRSKSWDEYSTPDAPAMDSVITVCDNAAGEICPFWPGHPVKTRWGFEDSAAAEGSDEDRRRCFQKVFRQIVSRVQLFVNLPVQVLAKNALQQGNVDRR